MQVYVRKTTSAGKTVEDDAAYVTLFIALAREGTDVRALFELKLLDQSGKERHKVHSHFGRLLESGPYTLKYRGSIWGHRRFFKRTLLESSDCLKDDCLQVHCSVGVVRSHTADLRLALLWYHRLTLVNILDDYWKVERKPMLALKLTVKFLQLTNWYLLLGRLYSKLNCLAR